MELPQPGIEPVPPALEAQSLNHWIARGVLEWAFNGTRPTAVHLSTDCAPGLAALRIKKQTSPNHGLGLAQGPGWGVSPKRTGEGF